MYCPKCSAQNVSDAKYCRQCGTDVGIVAKALDGKLVEKQSDPMEQMFDGINGMLGGMFEPGMKVAPLAPLVWGKKSAPDKQRKVHVGSQAKQPIERKAAKIEQCAPSIVWAYVSIFLGIAFLCISGIIGLLVPNGIYWWFWMLLPSFSMFGAGIAEFARLRQAARLNEGARLNEAIPNGGKGFDIASADNRTSKLDADGNPDTPRAKIADAPPSITEQTTRHLFIDEPNTPPTHTGERRTR